MTRCDGRTVAHHRADVGPRAGRPTEHSPRLGARVVLVGGSEERLGGVRDWSSSRRHGEDRFPIVVADMGVAGVRPSRGRHRPRDRGPRWTSSSTTPARSPGARRQPGRHRADASPRMSSGPFALIAGLRESLGRTRWRPGGHAVTSGRAVRAGPAVSMTCRRGRAVLGGPQAYARAKRAQVSLVREWARRLAAAGHPRSTPCIRAGRIRRVSRHRCPGSIGSWARCCGRPRRAWTRWSGWPRHRMAGWHGRAACSWTAGAAVRPAADDPAVARGPSPAVGCDRRTVGWLGSRLRMTVGMTDLS